MSEENIDHNQTAVSTPEPTFSKEDLEKSFSVRLQKEREKREAVERENHQFKERLQELQKKVEKGTASQSENQEYQTGAKAVEDTRQAQSQNMMSQEEADHYIQKTMNMNSMISQMAEASEKDPEFKDLISKNQQEDGSHKINQAELAFISTLHMKNKAAVIKHLLKNDKDNHIFKIAGSRYGSDNGQAASEFIYKLSEELESNLSKPGPSPFRAVPNLQDVGKGDEFDVDDYINNKY